MIVLQLYSFQLTSLTFLSLGNNQLTGCIPNKLSDLLDSKKLKVLLLTEGNNLDVCGANNDPPYKGYKYLLDKLTANNVQHGK